MIEELAVRRLWLCCLSHCEKHISNTLPVFQPMKLRDLNITWEELQRLKRLEKERLEVESLKKSS